MEMRGWSDESPAYKKTLEIVAKGGSFGDVVRSLQLSAKAEDDKRVTDAVELAAKQKLKEEGATGSEGGPSASGGHFTATQIGAMSYSEWVAKGRPEAARE